MTQQFHTIATHHLPHADELVAWRILQLFGEEEFPGVRDARLAFYDAGRQTPDGRPAEAWVAEGYFPLGIWGWWTDEHPTNGAARDGTCCATRVAQRLGIEHHPVLRQILRWVEVNDTQGTKGGPLDLSVILRALYEQHADTSEVAIQWFMVAINAKIHDQERLHGVSKEEFDRNAVVEVLHRPKGSTIKLCIIESDDEQVARYARASYGGNCNVVVQRRSTGHVAVLSQRNTRGFGVKLTDVVRLLRREELSIRHRDRGVSWKLLESDGTIEGLPEWYYQESAQNVLNGGTRAHEVAPTRIAFRRLCELVRIALSDSFEVSRAASCRRGVCTSKPGSKCPWYDFGLLRCRWIRAEEHKAREQGGVQRPEPPLPSQKPQEPAAATVEVSQVDLLKLFGGTARVTR